MRVPHLGQTVSVSAAALVALSVPAAHQQARGGERCGELRFDPRGIGMRDSLQMQHRTGQQLDATAQHAAGVPNASLVLIEALLRRVRRHAYIEAPAIVATVRVVEQHEIDVARAAPACRKTPADCVDLRQALDVPHGQPVGNARGGARPEPLEPRLDVGGHFAAQHQLAETVRAGETIRRAQRRLELRIERLGRLRTQWSARRRRLAAPFHAAHYSILG